MRRPDFIARQSREPRGVIGWIIANIMAQETADLNQTVLEALALSPTDQVLEIGFGHGRTLERAAQRVPAGAVVGVDLSETMVAMARRRCRQLIAEGRVRLERGDSSRLTFPDAAFDKVYSVHTIYFWSNPMDHLMEIHRVLKPGGRLVLGLRSKDDVAAASFPSSVYTFYDATSVRQFLSASGLVLREENATSSAGFDVLIAERPSK
jgi:ubiquinone/menaquinone biosynthesis C-methylase UbiE